MAEDVLLPAFDGKTGQPTQTKRGGLSGARRSTSTATEAPAAKETEPGPDVGGEGEARGRVTIKDPQSMGARSTGTGTGWQANINLGPGTSPDTAMAIQAREDRINQHETLQTLVDMRTSGFTRDQMSQWAALNDVDAAAAQELAQTQMPRIRQKVQDLQERADEARGMKVDPYHWHESIGRGGRVAAAFAALTGGFAAGKSNPNSALNMMDAAIERDIAAQETNIKNNIQSLKLQRNLAQDERQLVEDELQQMAQIRAIKYAAIVGRLQAAKQHAVTEAHHLALQTAQDHYELKYLHAKSAAEQEIFKLEYDGPVKNANHIAQLKAQAAQYQAQIRTGPSGGNTIPTEKVSTLEGDTVGGRPEVGIGVSTAGAPAQAPAPGRSRSVARRRPPKTDPGSPTAENVQETPAQAVAQDAEGNLLDKDGNIVSDQPEKKVEKSGTRVTPKNVKQWAKDPEIDAHPKAIKMESHARAAATGKGGQDVNVGLTTWSQAMEDIEAGREIRNGGMADHRDAKVIAGFLAQNGPPKRSQYGPGKEGAENIHYLKAMEVWEHTQKYPSILETSTYDQETGQKSKITVNGRLFTILPGSRDGKSYERVQTEISKYRGTISALREASRVIKRVGLTGMWRTNDDGDTEFAFPGWFGDADSDVMMLQRDAITQAMVYIKTHDPTARISDKDLEVGQKAAASYTGKGTAFVDWIQSMFNQSTKRDQIRAFMGKVVVEAQRIMYEKLEDDIVPDYNTRMALQKEYDANDKFIQNAPR